MIRQFLRIKNLPDSRLTKKIFNYDIKFSNLGRYDCWSTEINKILNRNNLGHYFSIPCNKKSLISSLTSSLLQHDIQMYYENCLSYSKLRLYMNIFDRNKNTTYLYKPLTFYYHFIYIKRKSIALLHLT